MREFIHNGKLLARLISSEDWEPGLCFFSKDDEFVQVGTWYYDTGRQLQDHIHNQFERTATRTYEVVYMVSGRMRVRLYTLDGEFVETLEIKTGDTFILLESGHGFEILENGTKVLEVKNGPFLGTNMDKTKF